jgi:hypothetical protein
MTNTTREMPRHVEVAYKDAVENIIFNKKQQWVTTNYLRGHFRGLSEFL